jgi:hypothetical protein
MWVPKSQRDAHLPRVQRSSAGSIIFQKVGISLPNYTYRLIPEDHNLYTHCCGNPKSHVLLCVVTGISITGSFICREITGRSFILTNNKTHDGRDQHSYLRCRILLMAQRSLTIHADKLWVLSRLRNQSFSSQNTRVEPAAECEHCEATWTEYEHVTRPTKGCEQYKPILKVKPAE